MSSRHFIVSLTIVAVASSGLATATASAATTRPPAGDIVVTSTKDDGPGTLRAAIENANARTGTDTITVDVSKPIALTTPLPAITDALTLIGDDVELRGTSTDAGLRVAADDVSISGFTIREFGTGIAIDRSSHVSVVKNVITDNRGVGITINGPTKDEVAALLASGTLDLAALLALIPADITVRENSIDGNDGPAVARDQEEIVRVAALETDGNEARGRVESGTGVVTVDVYASETCNAAAPQAATLIGTSTADAEGSFAVDVSDARGQLTAIATDESAGSSAVSACATPVTPPPTPERVTTTTVAPATTTTTVPPKPTPTRSPRRSTSEIQSFEAQAVVVPSCTKTWSPINGASWHDGSNWSPPGVPGPSDVACIGTNEFAAFFTGTSSVAGLRVDGALNVASGTLTSTGPSAVHDLTLSGGQLDSADAIELDGAFTWSSGTLGGAGTMTLLPGSTSTLPTTGTKSLSKPLVNEGTIAWTGGHLQMRSDLGGVGGLDNQATLNIDIPTEQTAGWCCGNTRPDFTNNGTVNVQSAAVLSLDNLDVTNTGAINLFGATLRITGSDSTIGGTITGPETAAIVSSGGGTRTFTGTIAVGIFDNNGANSTIASTADVDVDFLRSFGGALAVNAADANVNIDVLGIFGGDVTATTNLAPTSTFQWTSGSLGGTGTLTLTDGVEATLSGTGTKSLSAHLVNETTLDYLGGHLQMRSDLGGGVGHFDNRAIVNLNIATEQTAGWCCGNTRPDFSNSGTINVLSSAIYSLDNLDVTNIGTINLGTGTLRFTGSDNTIAGTIVGSDFSAVVVTSGNQTFIGSVGVGVFDVTGGSATFGNDSVLLVDFLRSFGGATNLNLADENLEVDVLGIFGGDVSSTANVAPTSTFQWTSGSLGGTGRLTLNDSVDAALSGTGTKSLSKILVNHTTVEYTGGHLQMRSDLGGGVGRFDNRGTLNINIASEQTAGWCCGSTRPDFFNSGTITLLGNALYSLDNLDLINTGTIDIGTATLRITGSSNSIGGTVTGTDTSALIITSGEQTFTGNTTVGILDVTGGAAIFNPTAHADLGFARALGGTLSFLSTDANTSIEVLTVGGGTLDSTTNLAPTDSFFWTSGALTGPGVLTLNAGVFSPWSTTGTKSLSKELVNKTTVNYTDGHLQMRSDLNGLGRLENRGTLNINIPTQQSMGWCCGPTRPELFNFGTINFLSNAVYSIDNLRIINTGTIDVGNATLELSGSTNDLGGTVTGTDSSALIVRSGEQTFHGTVTLGIVDVHGGAAIFNSLAHADLGFARTFGGILAFLTEDANTTVEVITVGGGTLDTSTNLAPSDSFFWTSGALTGPGVLTLNAGVFSPWSSSGTKSLSKQLVNHTTVNYTGGHLQMRSDLGGVGHLDNRGTLNIDMTSQQSAGWCCGAIRPDFTNSGSIFVDTPFIYSVDNLDISNTGTIEVHHGDFRLNGPIAQLSGTELTAGTWRVGDGATLRLQDADVRTNSGTIALEGSTAQLLDQNTASALRNFTTNNGTIELGAGTTLNVPTTFEQTSAGKFIAHIGNAGNGLLRVGTAADLDGTLKSIVDLGFTVPQGATFHVVDAATLTGTFATVEGDLAATYDSANGDVFLNGEAPPEPPVVTVTPASIPEAAGTIAVMVNGTGGNIPTDVFVSAVAGDASAPGDYTLASQMVTVPPNSSVPVLLTIVNDSADEFDEVFTILAGSATGQITILDDDNPPRAELEGLSITEGDDGQINADLTVHLLDPILGLTPQASGKTVVVQGITSDGDALANEDYVATTDTATFNPGQTTATLTVPIIGDTVDEPDEGFTVTLDALLDVNVPDNEDATVTIIDDDSPDAASPADELESGGQAVQNALPQWGEAFNLDEFDFEELGIDPFELPVVTDDLADVFDTANELGSQTNPLQNLNDDLDQMLDDLEALGFDVDWVQGGVGGRPTPPSANDVLQLRYETTLEDLAQTAGFTGDGLNDEMEGVLQGIASAYGLDASLVTSADLITTLVVGVDNQGFYLADDSGVTLALDATATVSGEGDVGGFDGLALSGTGTADIDVSLLADGGPARLRAAALAGDPRSYLRPSATGTATLTLEGALAPLTASMTSEHTLTVDGSGNTDVANEATLDAELDLSEFVLALHGTFDGTAWQLHGEGDADTDYELDGFEIENLTADATITPTTFTGSFDADLLVNIGGGAPLAVDLHATFNGSTLHATAHLELDDATFGTAPSTITLHGVTLDVTYDANLTTGTNTIVAALHADSLTGSVAGALEFSVSNVDLELDPNATGPVFTVESVTASMPDLGNITVTLTNFRLNRDGTFGADTVVVNPGTISEEIGIAGILPFDITEIAVDFTDPDDLDEFLVTVDGSFDFTSMESLPFDPIIGIGDDAVTPDSPAADNHFTFTIAVDSFAAGELRPYDFGPITLGFNNLDVGSASIDAALTLGGYEEGVWNDDDFGGTLTLDGIDAFAGDLGIAVDGELDVDAGTLDLTGVFSVSANLSDTVVIEDADLAFALGIAFADDFTITGPTLNGLNIGHVLLQFGDLLRLDATGVDIDFDPAPGEPLIVFETIGVSFDEGASFLADWGGSAGNVGISADFEPILLPGFFVSIDPPPGETFGLPDFIPFTVDDVKVEFPNVDFDNLPGEGLTLDDFSDFILNVSGGVVANDTWPISASVKDLEIDLGKLSRGEFPITNLSTFRMGVQPFELVPGFTIGGGLGLGTIEVDGDPAPGVQLENVFFGEIFGTFSFQGLGAGIHFVITEYGPVLAQVQVPLGIPIDGGFLGGVILASVTGGLKFGGDEFPNPERPLEILHDPAFDTDFPINDDTIHDAVEPAVQDEVYTWDEGFTLALSGDLTHALAPGIITGQVTIGANIGLGGGPPRLKLIGSGDVSVYGMPFAGAALLIDLANPLEPQFDLAFATPQPGNPLAFLMPATGTFEVSLDTTGILPGFALGIRTFVERTVAGGLGVSQAFFDSALTKLATTLNDDHSRPLAQLLLEGQPSSTVITRDFLAQGVLNAIAVGGNGLPVDPGGAADVAQAFMFEILDVGGKIVHNFDLSAVGSDPDSAAFADVLGAGAEAVVAMLGVLRDAALDAGQAFIDQLDPAFSLRGALQPVILGIPFGQPQHEVELIITKDGLGFGFETSFGEISRRIGDAIIPFLGSAAINFLSLGFEDQLGMTVELPIGGVVDGLFGGSGIPDIDPFDADWAIELRGGLRWNDFEIGQMTGLVIAAENQGFLDSHVQKLFENPDAPIDPNRIPIQNEQHYLDLLEHGGVLFNGRLLVPELLMDPIGNLTSLNLELPENPFDLPQWVADISAHLSQVAQPANVQIFLPGFASVLDFDFDATTEEERITASDTGQSLADKVNTLFAAAYLEGTFEGELLSVPIGRALVEVVGDGKIGITGEIPLIGLDGTFVLDNSLVDTPIGEVHLPQASAQVTVDDDDIDDVLARFGIPPIFNGLGNADSVFRAYSPGFDIHSSDPLLQYGGFELHSQLDLLSIVQDANFDMRLSANGNVSAQASVASMTPVPGITLTNGHVGFTQIGAAFAGSLDGTVTLPAWLAAATGVATAVVNGSFNSAGTVALSITINGVTYDLVALFNATVTQIVDFLRGLGKTFTQVVDILFDHVTQNFNAIVDQLVRIGANLFDIAEAIRVGAAASFNVIVDQLVRLGANFIQVADVLFQKVTTNVTTIVDQLVRKGASMVQVAEALFLKVTTNVTTIVDQLVRKGASMVQVAEALFLKVTTNVSTIVDQLVRKGASFIQVAEALFLKVTTNVSTIVDQLVRKAATFPQVAEALFLKVTTNVGTIVDELVRKGANVVQWTAAVFQKVTTNLTTIVDQMVRKGASFVQMVQALSQSAIAASISAIVDQLLRIGATFGQIAQALRAGMNATFDQIAVQLQRIGATFGQIVDALQDFAGATINQIAAALRAAGATFNQVATALQDFASASINAIAVALQFVGATLTQITDALDDATAATFEAIAVALAAIGASFTQITDLLDDATAASFSAIAAALKAAGATLTQITDLLDDATTASFEAIAAALQVAGATLTQITDLLDDATAATFNNIAAALSAVGATLTQITDLLDDATTASFNAIAAALQAVGASFLQITDLLDDATTATFDAIAAALQSIGATFTQITDLLDDATTASFNAIATALSAIGATLTQITDLLDDATTASFEAIAAALQVAGATFTQITDLLDDATVASFDAIAAALQSVGATLTQITDLLDDATTASFNAIAAALRAVGATFTQVTDLLDDATAASFNAIAAALQGVGATFTQITDLLDDATTASFDAIAAALQAVGATFTQITDLLDDATTASFDAIAAALQAVGASFTQITDLLDDATTASFTAIATGLSALGATFTQITDALDDNTAATFDNIAAALQAVGATLRQITDVLDAATSASFNTIANALRGVGASFSQIVDALDSQTSAGISAIADAIRAAGATFTQVMQALENELSVSRYDTAAQLNRMGASVNTIINALVSVYNATIDSIIDVLIQAVGLSVTAATNAVCSLLGCGL